MSAFWLFRKQSGKHFCVKSYTSANIKKLLNNTKNTYFPSLRQCTGERRTESVEGETSHEPQWVLCDASCVGGLCRCPSTGSPFGHHPRLRMVCPRRGQWVSTREDSVQLSPRASPPPHPHLHRAASGGGAPCLTAGDARTIVRANPWRMWTKDTPTPGVSH